MKRCVKAIVPITFRLPADLKAEADRAAAARRLSLNSFVEVALKNEVASACIECGQPARHVSRGATSEFIDFVQSQRGGSIYVRLERRGGPTVYKGRLPRIYGRHLHLDAESSTHNRGEQVILLDEIVDWEPARSGTGTDDWGNAHPGIPVDQWGLQ
jgi:uncharacterized protein (DUF1778 family)